MNGNPGFHRKAFGGTTVTALSDGYLVLPNEALLGIEPAEAGALRQAAFRGPAPRTSVNAFLVQSGGRTVLVDTGAGTKAYPTLGRLPNSLTAAGVSPGDVDAVVLTHLHIDHWGGLTTNAGAAAFPRAELVLPAGEAAYWLDAATAAVAPDDARPRFTGAQAAVAPYRDRMRTFEDGDAVPGLRAVPLPGHAPGHTGYLIEDGGARLLIWGDVMHVPDVQAPRPEVGIMFDSDPAAAVAFRRRVLDMVAGEGLMVAGMHLHFPGFVHVTRAGDGYALIPELWLAD
jgi:glyoxylase-like metal-dependent hydrolase (beta-lactamase superfamily II)